MNWDSIFAWAGVRKVDAGKPGLLDTRVERVVGHLVPPPTVGKTGTTSTSLRYSPLYLSDPYFAVLLEPNGRKNCLFCVLGTVGSRHGNLGEDGSTRRLARHCPRNGKFIPSHHAAFRRGPRLSNTSPR